MRWRRFSRRVLVSWIKNKIKETRIKKQETRNKKKMHECMTAWMDEQSAERRASGEGNWNQKKGKKMTAARKGKARGEERRIKC
jgi:hypothetical protein